MAWKAYNALLDNPRLLVFDSRPLRAYLERHIRGSFCVQVSSKRRSLESVAGPGLPAWSPDCWWGRHVLVVSPVCASTSDLEAFMQLRSGDGNPPGKRARATREDRGRKSEMDEVINFLVSEGRMKSLKILEIEDDGDKDSFSSFSKRYPFLVTRSQKASDFSGYPAEVVPKLLYLGDLEHAKAQKNLEDLQISHVLTIHTEPLKLSTRFVHRFYDLADEINADIAQYFSGTFEFVETARKSKRRVLVHCGAGASRSATLCAAYLMRANRWSADKALSFLKEQRRQVDPNPGFILSLQHYAREIGVASPSRRILDDGKSQSNSRADELSLPLVFDVLKEASLLGTIPIQQSDPVVCGRGASCNLVLDHTSISRQHAKLEHAGKSGVHITDLGSVHGTFVNNVRIQPAVKHGLQIGDVVTFGASTRRYVLRSAVF